MCQHALTRRADRNRTCNLRFWRPLLCQLSYRPRGPETSVRTFVVFRVGGCPDVGTAKECRLRLHHSVYGMGRVLANAGRHRRHGVKTESVATGPFAVTATTMPSPSAHAR